MATRRNVNNDETPRGRLLRRGAKSLSDAELLSILLRVDNEAADELLQLLGGMHRLVGIERSDLNDTSEARTAALLAAVEFGCRLARAQLPKRIIIRRALTIAQYLRVRYDRPSQEVMGALYLDVRHRLIHEAEHFRGCLIGATVEPRPILQMALAHHAARIILFHNHPSGDPAASLEDIDFSNRMSEACDLVGIKMEDHIIIGANGWAAIRQQETGSYTSTAIKW